LLAVFFYNTIFIGLRFCQVTIESLYVSRVVVSKFFCVAVISLFQIAFLKQSLILLQQ